MKNGLFVLLLLVFGNLNAQSINDYSVYLKPKQIPEMMGIQSFAFGQAEGKWVLVGGRLDGLHRRQPFAAFDSIGHNNHIIVIDPKSGELWKSPVDQLPANLRDQLKGTNICFTQNGDQLVLVGGYGIGELAADHQTFPFVTTVQLPALIKAVQDNQLEASLFHQTYDSLAAVTGGQLLRLGSVFYLVGGHRFDGRYNPADRPTFVQTYTNSVRRFTLDAAGNPTWLPAFTDSVNMHRRDFNVVLNQLPNGQTSLTAFSGVFQHNVDLPYQTAINITEKGLTEQPGFYQYYNHYHCADVSLFDPKTDEMHTLFFGGIAQYYDSLGILVQDNGVPFVSTISRVTRQPDGSMTECKFPVDMPALLGAGSEFIASTDLPRTDNGVAIFDAREDSLFLGTIVGGIASTGRNIFWINDDAESSASSGMFDVYLVKNAGVQRENLASNNPLHLHAVRHTTEPRYQVQFTLEKPASVAIEWTNKKGKVKHKAMINAAEGRQMYPVFLPKKPGFCRIKLTVENQAPVEMYFLIPEEE
ncbi:MAG: T9SS C-terminal target domain-containing protein [Bacteroidota bacterium]